MIKRADLLIALTLGLCPIAAAQNCPALSVGKKSALVEYVRKEYKLDSGAGLKIVQDEPVKGSCYHDLIFEGKSSVKTWQITMYLSPDGRFLTGELFDTTIDPAQEQRRKAEALMAGLVQNKGASKGPDLAPVTIVEFSDFECPFCKKLADLMKQVLPAEKDRVRIVFHHMPLSIHPWARTAAEGAACAQLQSGDAFWAMHDKLFDNQSEITPNNIKQKLNEFARSIQKINFPQFQGCMGTGMSLGLVFRDLNLAAENNIDATPTLFINGYRIAGIKDGNQLRQLIAEAGKEAKEIGMSSNALSHSGGRDAEEREVRQ